MAKKTVHVLLASAPTTPVRKIEEQLKQTIGLDCHLRECTTFSGCMNILQQAGTKVDMLLLDLGLMNTQESEDFFIKMKEAARGKPIIVFTRAEDRELALFMVNEGADIISGNAQTRKTEPNRLGDILDYTWIRHSNALKDKEEGVANLLAERERSADRLKVKDWVISRLRQGNSANPFSGEDGALPDPSYYSPASEGRHEKAMQQERDRGASALQREITAGRKRLKEKDQMISWMRGGYSVENSEDISK